MNELGEEITGEGVELGFDRVVFRWMNDHQALSAVGRRMSLRGATTDQRPQTIGRVRLSPDANGRHL